MNEIASIISDNMAGIRAGQSDQVENAVDMARRFRDNAARLAGVVELVDAPDSKSGARNGVGVQVPPPAPYKHRDSDVNRTNAQRVIGTDTVVS